MFVMATRAEQILARKGQILFHEEEKKRLDKERQEFELQEKKRLKLEEEERKRREDELRDQREKKESRSVFETLGVMQVVEELRSSIPNSAINYWKQEIKSSLYEYSFYCLSLHLGDSGYISIRYTPGYKEIEEDYVKGLFGYRGVKKSIRHNSELRVGGDGCGGVVGKDGTLDDLVAQALAHPNYPRSDDSTGSYADDHCN